MRKIKDRFLLGMISGLGGNIAKIAVERAAVSLSNYSETGAKKAAGIFLKKMNADSVPGKVLGNIADNMIASFLGVSCVYWLTLMGKDYYLLKGAALGAAEWTALYGVTSKIGATNIYPSSPKNALISFLSHLAFGAAKIAIAVHLGDNRLFKKTTEFEPGFGENREGQAGPPLGNRRITEGKEETKTAPRPDSPRVTVE